MAGKIVDGKLVMQVAHVDEQNEPVEDPSIRETTGVAREEEVLPNEDEPPHQEEGVSPYADEQQTDENGDPIQEEPEQVEEKGSGQRPKGQNFEDLPEEIKQKIAFADEINELTDKHPDIAIAWGKARMAEGRSIPSTLRALIEAQNKEAPKMEKPAGVSNAAQTRLEKMCAELGISLTKDELKEYYEIVREGELAEAQLWLMGKALTPMRDGQKKQQEEQRVSQEKAETQRLYNEGMVNLANVHKEFFEITKGGKTAVLRGDKNSQLLGKKMVEVAQRHGMPERTPLNIVTDIALAELGWLGKKPQAAPQPKVVQTQQQARRVDRPGRGVVRNGMLHLKIKHAN